MLTRSDLVAGLRTLGVQPGDRVLAHASLAAFGPVDGGADTVIDALLDAVGSDGLVVVPTFACRPPFDRRTSATPLGAIPDRFWRRPEAVRSLHPTHSVAAIGAGAAELLRGHELAPTAYAEGTPYWTLAMGGGKVLLLGVDQDRNTTLHAAEAIAGAPYLTTIQGTYLNDDGKSVTIPIAAMAGPHRDFIGLDHLFREQGVMRMEKIGKARCRLLDGKAMLETAIAALRQNPAAVLCDNPACADCVRQRGAIKAARLAAEDFTLAAVAGDIADDLPTVLTALRGEGIAALEVTMAEFQRYGAELPAAGVRIVAVREDVPSADAAALAKMLQVPLILPCRDAGTFATARQLAATGATIYIENRRLSSDFFLAQYKTPGPLPGLAFNPGRFASAGQQPFLAVFYRGVLRKQTKHFYIDDATMDGAPALPGQGNGEVKEIMSMLRCRGFDGVMTLRAPTAGLAGFRQAATAFWRLLDNM